MGVREWLRGPGGMPDAAVVNLPRCPGHGEDLVATLVYILVNGTLPELDSQGRPVFLYGKLIHDQCERRANFEAGEFVEKFGDEGSLKRWCLYKVGLQGPGHVRAMPHQQVERPRELVRELRTLHGLLGGQLLERLHTVRPAGAQRAGSCHRVASAPRPSALGLAGVTAVGLGAHFVGQVATGRMGKGAPQEHEAVTRKAAGLDADSPAEKKGGDV